MTALLTLALVGLASAGAPPGEARTLAEHRFVVPQHLSSPWITSHVAFRQGFGWLGVPDYRYPGIPTRQPLNLLGLSESLEGQVRVQPWLAIWARASGAVHTGVDTRTVLFVGGRGTYDLRGAARIRLVRTERTQLAAHLGVQRFDALGIVPADLAVAVLDDPQGVVRRAASLPTDVRSGLDLTSVVFYDRSDLTLGVVLDAATASAFGTRQWELGLEGRAMAFF